MSDQRIGTATVCLTPPPCRMPHHRPRPGPRPGRCRACGPYRRGMGTTWEPGTPGSVTLPSGRTVRGRGLRGPVPPGQPPELGVYLLGRRPPVVPWDSRWVVVPDFRVPRDAGAFREVLLEVLERAGSERVELACRGG